MFDPHDDRQRGLAIGIVMVAGGVAGLVLMIVEHWGYVSLLVKAITLLLVYGSIRIWLALSPKATAAAAARARGRRPGGDVQVLRMHLGALLRSVAPRDETRSLFDGACLAIGRLGVAVAVLSLLCMLVAALESASHGTVIVAGIPDHAPGWAYLAALAFSAVVGLCWARLVGGALVIQIVWGLVYGIFLMLLLVVPLAVTGGEMAEAMMFSGRTSRSTQALRVEAAYMLRSSKGGASYYAEVNPYHRAENWVPEVQIDSAAYQRIHAHMVETPANPDYPGDRPYITDLCMIFTVERAGAAVRLHLAHFGPYRVDELRLCPPGAA